MADEAALRFLSWMRRGLARAVTGTGTVEVSVAVNGEALSHTIRVRGPGDVAGLASRQVLRTDPPDGTVDFEPNYFAAVELASPDLPWMFTPAAPAANKLTPWLVLVVVREAEGVTLVDGVLSIVSPAVASAELPDLAEAWAWAHVQSAVEIAGDVGAVLAATPEALVARLLCPRRLDASTWYRACVVPGYAQGVRAGLGETVDPADLSPAWTSTTASVTLPVYHSWRFRTGPEGDFESLVRRLTARELPSDVGLHDLNVGSPGGGLPEQPGLTLSYQGALRAPSAEPRAWKEPHRSTFQRAMQAILAAPTPFEPDGPYQPLRDDPVLAPPSYGLAPSGEGAVPAVGEPPVGSRAAGPIGGPIGGGPLPGSPGPEPTSPEWLGEVNLDPVHRATAGLGAEVVRRNQERFAATIWEQVGPLRDINRLLARSRLAAEIGLKLKARVGALDDGALLQVAAPSLSRMADTQHGTLATRAAASAIPSGVVSAAFRRALRPGGTAARSLGAAGKVIDPSGTLTARIAADPATMLAFTSLTRPVGTSIEDGAGSARTTAEQIRVGKVAPAIKQMMLAASAARATRGKRTRRAARVDTDLDLGGVVIVEHLPPLTNLLALPELAQLIRVGLDPVATISARLRASITAPATAWATQAVPERMLATPVIDDPTYEMLVAITSEYMVPGLGTVPPETVALLEPNDAFLEAFVLGANHELARELMWREVPVDLLGTWIRRFWDGPDAAGDVPTIDAWSDRALGRHVTGTAKAVGIVVLIKGTLLRRYPDTRIYAVPAAWNSDRTERIEDTTRPRAEPLFSGHLGNDASFHAFSLSEADARGDTDGLGFFLVFEECPSGPRFGLDVEKETHAGDEPRFWKNVSWGHLVESLDALSALTHVPAGGRLTGKTHRYDKGAFEETWGEDAAAMARITFQRPVRMLIHMNSMLPEKEG